MSTIKLLAADKSVIAELPAYKSLYDVPLNRYIDFIKAQEPLADTEKVEAGEVKVPRVVATCVGEFFGVGLDGVLRAKYGEYENEHQVDGGLQSLYFWIARLIGDFRPKIRTPEDAHFEYQGDRFVIPTLAMSTLASLPMLPPDLETGESIEAYDIRRVAMRDAPKDADGSHLYSYYLQLIATLCRKEGEGLPTSTSDCDRFINERAAYFAGIDAGTALDVDFFLAGLTPRYAKALLAIGFLSNHAIGLVRAIQGQRPKKSRHSTGLLKGAGRISRKPGTGASILSYSKGGGSARRVKVPSKQ